MQKQDTLHPERDNVSCRVFQSNLVMQKLFLAMALHIGSQLLRRSAGHRLFGNNIIRLALNDEIKALVGLAEGVDLAE